MKVRNISKNTLYAEDIDLYVPFKNGEIEELSPDILKKSKALRGFILGRLLEVVEHNPQERIEASIIYLLNKQFSPKNNEEPAEAVFPDPPKLKTCEDKIDVKIHGIFYDAGGYGKVNRNLALKLSESGLNVKVVPKRSQNQLNEDEIAPIAKLEKTEISPRNHILIDSIIPSFAEMSTGKYRILYTTIESYTVPEQFIKCCEMYHEIWTTCEFATNILKKYIKDKPIFTIPTGVDTELYTQDGPRFDFKPNINNFVFVSVFGWNYRKGYDVLLKAYLDEFDSSDDVSLLIVSRYQYGTTKFHRNKIKEDIDKIMAYFPNKSLPHIVRYSQIIPEKQMPQLYRAADCFILTTRGESMGLPPLEASMCGLPVIMTNCSGQQAYLRENNAYLIQPDRIEKMKPGQMKIHYWDDQEFPILNSKEVHDQVKKAMRTAATNEAGNKIKNNNMKEMILNNFTWNHTANAAVNRLKEISKQIEEKS